MSKLKVRHYSQKPLDIVLIHGWGLHSGVWQKLIEYLQTFANITVIDRAGYGHSQIMSHEDELNEILANCPPKAVYIGWSLGVSVILQLATQHPQRVQAIVALAADPCFVARNDWPYAMPIENFQQFQQDTEENEAGQENNRGGNRAYGQARQKNTPLLQNPGRREHPAGLQPRPNGRIRRG